MITSIEKIKGEGVLCNYSWDNNLPNFKNKVLFYGCNGSGKSSLVKAISLLTSSPLESNISEISVCENDKTILNSKNGSRLSHKCFIFNKEFVEKNSTYNKMEQIVYISEENISLKKALSEVETLLVEVASKKELLRSQKDNINKELDTLCIDIAKRIKDELRRLEPDRYGNYDKGVFKKDMEKSPSFPDDGDLKIDELRKLCLQTVKEIITPVTSANFEKLIENLNIAQDILTKDLLSSTVEIYKADIMNWLRNGLSLEQDRQCFYCGNLVSDERKSYLDKLFKAEFQSFQSKVTTIIDMLTAFSIPSVAVESKQFYDEFKDDIKNSIIEYNSIRDNFVKEIEKIVTGLCSKRDNSNEYVDEALDSISSFLDTLGTFQHVISTMNRTIALNNEQTEQFQGRKNANSRKLYELLVAKNIKESHIFDKKDKATETYNEFEKAEQEEARLVLKKKDIEKQINSAIIAAEAFNKMLHAYLGRAEFNLVFDSDKKGYKLVRQDGTLASNLSEGEITAIAFIYFITKVFENGNLIENSIIIFDDPVSSLDSNNLFGAYSFIVAKFSKCYQLFILTHNYTFYKMFKKKFCKSSKDEKKNTDTICYMVDNSCTIRDGNKIRSAKIISLPKSLKNCNSEHAYLFKSMKEYVEKVDIDLDDYYRIANVARKFLEGYTHFRFPHISDLTQRVEQICSLIPNSSPFFANRLIMQERIIKFTNWYSHEHDEELESLHESKDVIKDILNVLQAIDNEHYKALGKATTE